MARDTYPAGTERAGVWARSMTEIEEAGPLLRGGARISSTWTRSRTAITAWLAPGRVPGAGNRRFLHLSRRGSAEKPFRPAIETRIPGANPAHRTTLTPSLASYHRRNAQIAVVVGAV